MEENSAADFNIHPEHFYISQAIIRALAGCCRIPEHQLSYNTPTDSKTLKDFDLQLFIMELESILEVYIDESKSKAMLAYPFPSYFFGIRMSCRYPYLGDWIYWFIYVLIKYASIGLRDGSSEFITGQEYLDRAGLTIST